jgi:hypothetical protein
MFITEVKVKGDTDKVYTITVGADGNVHCSCPDHFFRGTICKHMMFISEMYVKGVQHEATMV